MVSSIKRKLKEIRQIEVCDTSRCFENSDDMSCNFISIHTGCKIFFMHIGSFANNSFEEKTKKYGPIICSRFT